MKRAMYNVQRATRNVKRATCSIQRATSNVQRATCIVPRATCHVHRAACSVQRATCSVQRATCNVQRSACSVRRATCNAHCTTCNVHCTTQRDNTRGISQPYAIGLFPFESLLIVRQVHGTRTKVPWTGQGTSGQRPPHEFDTHIIMRQRGGSHRRRRFPLPMQAQASRQWTENCPQSYCRRQAVRAARLHRKGRHHLTLPLCVRRRPATP
jgi:Tfp pilus assembly protein PilX